MDQCGYMTLYRHVYILCLLISAWCFGVFRLSGRPFRLAITFTSSSYHPMYWGIAYNGRLFVTYHLVDICLYGSREQHSMCI